MADAISAKKILNTKELAELLGVAPSTLEKMRGREEGPPFVMVGGSVRYWTKDVEHFLAQGGDKKGCSEP